MTQSDIRALAEAAFVVLAFFVLAPTVAAVYRASNVKPKNFDREMYWTAFIAVGAVAAIITRYAVHMGGRGRCVVKPLAIHNSWTRRTTLWSISRFRRGNLYTQK